MVYAQPRSWKMRRTNSGEILTYNRSLNLGQFIRPYNNYQKEGTCKIVDFAVPADHGVKLKDSELKKTVEHESDDYTNCNWCSWYSHQMIGSRTEGLGNNGASKDQLNYSIVEIGQNTEKSPGDLGRLAVTQTRIWKTLNKKKTTCQIVDFAIPQDHWVKLKESEKKDKYQDLSCSTFFKNVELMLLVQSPKVWFGFFVFNVISTFLGYLMPKPFS